MRDTKPSLMTRYFDSCRNDKSDLRGSIYETYDKSRQTSQLSKNK